MATSTDIQYKTINQFAQLYLDYISSKVPSTLVAPLGPVLTAIAFATALVSVALQRLIQLVLKAARLSTAEGIDVDSFVADFGLARLAGVRARGTVEFVKNSAAVTSILIPTGSIVQTSSNPPLQFVVIADTLQPNYSVVLSGYQLNAGQTSVSVTVQCVEVGTQGNVSAGAINQIASSVSGIDNVANALGFTTGIDEEADVDLKNRFVGFIQAFGKATVAAITSAINSVQSGLYYAISEYNGVGGTPNGIVNVYLDDGAGTITGTIISQVAGAIDAARPAGVRVDVTAATPSFIAAAVRVVSKKSLVQSQIDLRSIIRSAILERVNANTPPGSTLHFATLYKAIFNSFSPGDAVFSRIATYPPSSTTVIQLESTEGFIAGQLIEVVGSLTFTGNLPVIISVDSLNQIQISPALTAIPVIGSTVRSFTVDPDQIEDIHDLSLIAAASVASTTLASTMTLTNTLVVASATGFAIGEYIILTNETNPLAPVYYQTAPSFAVLPKILNIVSTTITLEHPIGVLTDVSPFWAVVGSAGVPFAPTGSKVLSVPATGVFSDIVPATAQTVLRLKALAANALLVQMEQV